VDVFGAHLRGTGYFQFPFKIDKNDCFQVTL